MEEAQQINEKGKVKVGRSYNSWTVEQTNLLLQLMLEVVNRGWRDANGLLSKKTVETWILPSLNEKLNCNKTYNNYQSRLKWFKAQYQRYTELMHNSSGFGWDPITRRFTASEEVWKDYLKSHPKERHFYTEHYVDYDDLRVLIGNVTVSGRNSIGLGDDTDARAFGLEDTHVGIEDYEYDADNGAFVQSQHEPLHESESLEKTTSPLSHQTMSSKVPSKATSQKKRNKIDFEGPNSFQNTYQANIIEKLSYDIDSIAADFRKVRNIMEKMESDREKREIEKKEKERKSNIWDAIKETPNLDSSARYEALAMCNTKTKKRCVFEHVT
ncbi:hypothetical protein Ddye_013809 [Dipteronia dyeriana]|uniref:Myb/SANT-like domain-containing protein n=1 Tax=Dipteronia dyeriana TaxID=168575 RepID=A0AAE0CKJ2_9ROSI|nr:hypothetical protein Ddye_013809 [Dipteronia dyeriana]